MTLQFANRTLPVCTEVLHKREGIQTIRLRLTVAIGNNNPKGLFNIKQRQDLIVHLCKLSTIPFCDKNCNKKVFFSPIKLITFMCKRTDNLVCDSLLPLCVLFLERVKNRSLSQQVC